MGDHADEAIENGWLAIEEDGSEDYSFKTCECGKTLIWSLTTNGWKLFDHNGKLHKCILNVTDGIIDGFDE